MKLKGRCGRGDFVMERTDCITRLTGKDAADACACAAQITGESRESDCWTPWLEEFAELLHHKNSLVRNRAISILAANARWADEEAFDRLMDEFLLHVTDEKPITARQCIQALPEIAAGKPRLVPRIRQTLENADLTGYRDSMRPLILKDIIAALEQLG